MNEYLEEKDVIVEKVVVDDGEELGHCVAVIGNQSRATLVFFKAIKYNFIVFYVKDLSRGPVCLGQSKCNQVFKEPLES